MKIIRHATTVTRFGAADTVSRLALRLTAAVTTSLLLATSAAVTLPALAADDSASDIFAAKVMLTPQPRDAAPHSASASADDGTAADRFVETVLKGNPGTHRLEIASRSVSAADDQSRHGPDLHFLYGSGARD